MQDPHLSRKVLLVDDDAGIREILSCILRLEGCSVLEAKSGEDAIAILASEPKIRMVMSDLQMPNGDGFWLMERLEALNAALPVVVMTGDHSIDPTDLRLKRAKTLFYKPFLESYEQMVSRIRQVLRDSV
jgi:DNA-binding NtrC family response regulator